MPDTAFEGWGNFLLINFYTIQLRNVMNVPAWFCSNDV